MFQKTTLTLPSGVGSMRLTQLRMPSPNPRTSIEGPSETSSNAVGFAHALEQYVAEARRRHPELSFVEGDFLGHVTERSPDSKLPPLEHAGDLLLAFCCARREPMAHTAFYKAYSDVISRVLTRRGGRDGLGQDAAQLLFERLLVGSAGAQPKLTDYRGVGPLRSWVATTAATTLLMMQRAEGRRKEEPSDSSAAPFARQLDPELDYLKQRYSGDVHAALVTALGELSDRDKTLLRLHLVQRLSIDQLGAMYQVNRATTARWLVAAKKNLVDGAKAALRNRLKLSESECDSLVGLVQSQLGVSIARHLQSAADADSISRERDA